MINRETFSGTRIFFQTKPEKTIFTGDINLILASGHGRVYWHTAFGDPANYIEDTIEYKVGILYYIII